MGLNSTLSNKFISRAVWLASDWQREFDAWIQKISLLLVSNNRTTFYYSEWSELDPIQDEARQAKKQNNMLGYRAALKKYAETAETLLAAAARTENSHPLAGLSGAAAAGADAGEDATGDVAKSTGRGSRANLGRKDARTENERLTDRPTGQQIDVDEI